MNDCEYCKSPYPMYVQSVGFFTKMDEGAMIREPNESDANWYLITAGEDGDGWGTDVTYTEINYCPWCGRKLEVQDDEI